MHGYVDLFVTYLLYSNTRGFVFYMLRIFVLRFFVRLVVQSTVTRLYRNSLTADLRITTFLRPREPDYMQTSLKSVCSAVVLWT